MWTNLAKWVLRYRLPLLIVVFAFTAVMGYFASRLQLSYEFSKAIPTDNEKYLEYQAFRQRFGDDGNMMVVGWQTDSLFQLPQFSAYMQLQNELKKVKGVESILSVPAAINLVKDTLTEQLAARPVFSSGLSTQAELDSSKQVFLNLPFYRNLLYNPDTHTYLMAIGLNKELINSKARTVLIHDLVEKTKRFEASQHVELALSGLPLIRTMMSGRIQKEMQWFLIGSVVLFAIILLLFFRSVSATLISILVVGIGVVWSCATSFLLGYKITLLTGMLPPLIVVIGIPNCIYFINKYHTEFRKGIGKEAALVNMVGKMGIVTLMCNVAAAIGFAVFAFTKSDLLKEFGTVAGINIMGLFVVSFIVLPSLLSYLPDPKPKHMVYLDNAWLNKLLLRVEKWVFHYRGLVWGVTIVVLGLSVAGILRLKNVGYIVDDLPKTDKIYRDLKFFEHHFHGVMPLEIVVDTKKKYGLSGAKALGTLEKMDELSQTIQHYPEMARPLSVAEALKFVKQAFYDGDSTNYTLPNSFDGAFVGEYLSPKPHAGQGAAGGANNFTKLLNSFIDSSKQQTRLSVNMADVGTARLPVLLDTLRKRADQLFDSTKYKVTFTGASVTFLEGSRFIINGLKDSIMWAFILIALCMLYLFRSVRILICSLIPNIIPLVITAGIMGWAGIALKPSTVLIFSVALGIAIDVTIRFLVNYKQELPNHDMSAEETVRQTIAHTGISIIYTSLVLIVGFVIFCFSSFGGTQALGWLTSLTLLVAMITNLVLLPVLLIMTTKKKKG